ncbi:response regulator [Phenylobacterium sp.]|uniref:response regulator n=1 Tax=Phenylobacterium sp. TaxID=1871053 RepID=UPI0035B023D0
MRGLRVFIVEDEPLVAVVLQDMVVDSGGEVAATAQSVVDALAKMDLQPFDMAVLDVDLAGRSCHPVAAELRRRKIPFLFASGSGEHALHPQDAGAPVLHKPFAEGDLMRAMTALQPRPGSAGSDAPSSPI